MHKTIEPEIIEGEVLQKARDWKYEPWMCQAIIESAKQGKRIAGWCNAIGIKSKDTFYRWKKEFPEFAEAIKEAELHSQELYEDVMFAGGMGKIKNFNFNPIAMLVNNCFKDDYSRSATGSNTEVNIGTFNNLKTLDVEKLMARAAKLQEEYLELEEQGTDSDGASRSSAGTGAEEEIL